MQIILGSQSPRRREILSYFSLPFRQVSPSFDEDSIPFEGNPTTYVQTLSRGKADSLIDHFPKEIILTADTIVYKQGKIYGKPKNKEEAFSYLKELAGQWHSVYTGITIRNQQQEFQDIAETRVLFHPLTDEQIRIYGEKLPCSDKAGGYMIQQAGGIIVERIEGCYYNVIGLPLTNLHSLLLRVGIDLWKYIKAEK